MNCGQRKDKMANGYDGEQKWEASSDEGQVSITFSGEFQAQTHSCSLPCILNIQGILKYTGRQESEMNSL